MSKQAINSKLMILLGVKPLLEFAHRDNRFWRSRFWHPRFWSQSNLHLKLMQLRSLRLRYLHVRSLRLRNLPLKLLWVASISGLGMMETALASDQSVNPDDTPVQQHTLHSQSTQANPNQLALDTLFQSQLPRASGGVDTRLLTQCPVSQNLSRKQRSIINKQLFIDDDISKVYMAADSVPVKSETLLHLKGNVVFRDETSELRAGEIKIDQQTQTLEATGGISLESVDAFFRADKLSRSHSTQNVKLDNPQFFILTNNANGTAKQITIDQRENIRFQSLALSTCPVDQKTWQIRAQEMNVDTQAGYGEAYHTIIEVGEVPVFYLPYISFPIDNRRKTGFLMPNIRNSSEDGLQVQLPLYVNIAPHMDATITPAFIEKRGEQLGAEFRHLSQYGQSEVDIEWMASDSILRKRLEDPLAVQTIDASSNERWLIHLQNESRFNQNWRAQLDASRVSDSDYFRDFGSGIESSNLARLTSEFNLYYADEHWDMRWFALGHQSLIGVESYRYLPSWVVNGDYQDDWGLRWQWHSEATRFEHSSQSVIEGERYHLAPSVSLPLNASWGFFNPKLSYWWTEFAQRQPTSDSIKVSRQLPIFSFDAGLYFDREFSWNNEPIRQSLEPRIFYTDIPFRDQSEINVFDTAQSDFSFAQLWRENRFNGIDRIGDTQRLSVALANRFFALNRGEEIVHFQLGRSLYYSDRQVQLNSNIAQNDKRSPWLAQLDVALSKALSFHGFIEWEQGQSQTNQAQSRINFEPKANHIVNVSHRYRNIAAQSTEEVDVSFAWPINDQWRLVGRHYQNIDNNRVIESMAGIEYESCCWAVRIVGQRYLNLQLDATGVPIAGEEEYNDGIYFQFVFKGIGAAGQSKLDELLTTSIYGYQDPYAKR